MNDKSNQVIIQGVHELYDLEETQVNWQGERLNRMVFIGKLSFLRLLNVKKILDSIYRTCQYCRSVEAYNGVECMCFIVKYNIANLPYNIIPAVPLVLVALLHIALTQGK